MPKRPWPGLSIIGRPARDSTTPTALSAPAWELYNLSNDYSQAKDLARAYPDRLAELKKLFQLEGERNKVFPIDPRVNGRQRREAQEGNSPTVRAGSQFLNAPKRPEADMLMPVLRTSHSI